MPRWDVLIRGGQVVTPEGVTHADVAIDGEKFVEIAPELSGDARETIDATGLHVFPGLIDPHVHFNEPGRTEWEGFETGSSALAAGGGTCFFDMPLNASPPTLDGESFDLKLAAAKANSRTDFALWGGLTPGNLDKMEELAERGVVGFKAFMSGSGIDDFVRADDLTLHRGMKIAARLKLPVAVHAESEEITSRLAEEARRRGGKSWDEYIASRPIIAEVEAVQRAVAFAEDTGCSLHVVHVSSLAGVEVVRRTQAHEWADVTCEVCAHHLFLTDEDQKRCGASAKCAPPLRPRAEVEKLFDAVWHEIVPIVASDHSPSPPTMKSGDDAFAAWGGVAGIQSTRAVLFSSERQLPLSDVANLTADNVARRFGIAAKGRMESGFDADVSVVDLSSDYTLTREMLLDRHKLSPYVDRTFRGLVKRTIVRGHTVFEDGKIVAGDFRGRLVTPDRRRAAGDA